MTLYEVLVKEPTQSCLELSLGPTVVSRTQVDDGQGGVKTERREDKVLVLKTVGQVAITLLSEVL